MIFLVILLVKIFLSICICLIMIRFLNPIIINLTQKMFNSEIQASWIKYIQVALFIIGLSSGIDIYTMKDFITRTNKNLTIERILAEGWGTLSSSALSIVIAMMFLFFLFFIINYLNQLATPQKTTEKKQLFKSALKKEESDEKP